METVCERGVSDVSGCNNYFDWWALTVSTISEIQLILLAFLDIQTKIKIEGLSLHPIIIVFGEHLGLAQYFLLLLEITLFAL